MNFDLSDGHRLIQRTLCELAEIRQMVIAKAPGA